MRPIVHRWLDQLAKALVLAYVGLIMSLVLGWPGAVLGSVIGWFVMGWIGAGFGIIAGPIVWVVVAAITYYMAIKRRLHNQHRKMANMPTDQLRKIAADPTSPDLGFAIGELDQRGIEASPSFESLLALLTSEDSNRRGLGLSLLSALYPEFAAKLPEGSSNADAPEIWRVRIAGMRERSE